MKDNTKKKTTNHSIVKFVQITKDFAPKIEETNQDTYIRFGEDNQLPYVLTDLYASVSLHKGIISKKELMIRENGLILDESDFTDENAVTANKTLEFYENVNESETFSDIWERIISDFVVYGGAYLQIIWSRDGSTINKIYNMPVESMRAEKADENGIINGYYYNPDRTKAGKYKKYTKTTELEYFPTFGSEDKTLPQIYYIKKVDPLSFYYGLPDYSSAITDLDTFRSISEFHNSNIHNGMQPSYVIMFKGPVPSPDKQNKIIDAIKSKHKGIENAGKPLIFFLDNEDLPKLETVENSEVDKMYQELYSTTQENIITAHQIPRVLANVTTEGSLGSGKEYIDAEKIFDKNYIQPTQEFLLGKINIIFDINELVNLKIQKVEPDLSVYPIDELLKLYTPTEIKELLGLPAAVTTTKK